MSAREEFIEIYQAQITRPGADALLEYLEHKSDFFTAPSSTHHSAPGTLPASSFSASWQYLPR